MGFTTEFYAEKKRKDGLWKLIDLQGKNKDPEYYPKEIYSYHGERLRSLFCDCCWNKPIVENYERGLPENISDDLRKIINEYFPNDEHWGHSWILLSEFFDFNWDQYARDEYSYVESKYAKYFTSPPSPFPYDKVPTERQWERYRGDDSVEVEWQQTYREITIPSLWETFEMLKQFGDPKDIRILYWMS